MTNDLFADGILEAGGFTFCPEETGFRYPIIWVREGDLTLGTFCLVDGEIDCQTYENDEVEGQYTLAVATFEATWGV